MESDLVIRIMNTSWIIWDLFFLVPWFYILYKRNFKHVVYTSIIFGLYCAFQDAFVWYNITQTRVIIWPDSWINDDNILKFVSRWIWYIYYDFSYPAIMLSLTMILLAGHHRVSIKEKIVWLSSLYIGWYITHYLTVNVPIFMMPMITVTREMGSMRNIQMIMVIGGLNICNLLLNDCRVFLLLVLGFVIYFAMEFNLYIHGIRNVDNIITMVDNSIIEWNSGLPVMFLGTCFIKDWMIPNGCIKFHKSIFNYILIFLFTCYIIFQFCVPIN